MELVIDANILFAALIGRGKTQELFFENKIKLIAPLKLIEEFEKNINIIAEKGKVSVDELLLAFELLRERIELYATDNIKKDIRLRAQELSPHTKDIPYFALALHVGAGIWSNDKVFKNQSKVRIYSTRELVDMFLI